MSSADPLAALADSQRNELELLLMEFDRSWKPTLLSQYCDRLAAKNEQYRRIAISELAKIDLQRCWSNGKGLLLEDYCEQIPLLGPAQSVDPDLILIEFEARSAADATLRLDSYADRFPSQYEQVVLLARDRLDSSHAAQVFVETSRLADVRDTAPTRKSQPVTLPKEFGRYRILSELGSGAMGTVYLAHDSQLDRKGAIKTPDIDGDNDDELVVRFYREARAAAKIHHRNICPIYDVGEIDGRHFISMALIEGRTLSELIKSNQQPSPKSCAILIQRLASAMAEAHHHSVVHRDLKPSNIMMDMNQEPVVMDFGLCQTDVESRMTKSGMMVGTPAYMSPEQISGDPSDVGPLADIYALGVILYELLTGQLPFRGTIAQVMYQIVHEESLAPSQIRPELDPRLDAIVAEMMEKNHHERIQTMDEVATALNQYLNTNIQTDLTRTRKAESSPHSCSAEPIAAEEPLVHASRSSGRFRNKRKMFCAGLVGGFILASVIIFLFRTPYGIIRVKTIGDLDGLEVLVDGDTINLRTPKSAAAREHELALKLGGVNLVFDPDTCEFVVKQDGAERRLTVSIGDLQLSSTTFTVTSDRETILTIELVDAEIASPPLAVAPFDRATAKRHQHTWAEYLGVDVEKVVELPDGMSMTMVLVPPGEFLMGSPNTEQRQFLDEQLRLLGNAERPGKYRRTIDRIPGEGPQHRVRIRRPFYLGRYEVTQAQWQAVVGNNPSEMKGPAKPVEHVTWNDVQRFLTNLNLLSQLEWMEFVLPTEAQWEYACRAGTTTPWHCRETALQEHAWFAANSFRKTHPVGELQPNAWGLYDMHGNVREWCRDWYNEKYYSRAPMNDPRGATGPSDEHRGFHVLRGGDFSDPPGLCRSAHRSGGSKAYRSPARGFRLAMSINTAKLNSAAADEPAPAKSGVEDSNQ